MQTKPISKKPGAPTRTRRGKIDIAAERDGYADGVAMLRAVGNGKTVDQLGEACGIHPRNLIAYLKQRGLKFSRHSTITGIVPDNNATNNAASQG